MVAVGIAAIISSFGFGFSGQGLGISIVIFMVSLAVAGGQGIAGFMCRRKYVMAKYMLWAALWEIVLIAIPLAFYAVFAVIMIAGRSTISGILILFSVAVSGGVLGALVYAMSIPFLILVQKNSFWRERFLMWTQAANQQPVILAEPQADIPVS
jgi:hypothetical protein